MSTIFGGLENLLPGPLDALMGPYPNVAAANAAIENNLVEGVSYRSGKVVMIGTVTDFKYFTWIGGFDDDKLLEFTPTSAELAAVSAAAEEAQSTADAAATKEEFEPVASAVNETMETTYLPDNILRAFANFWGEISAMEYTNGDWEFIKAIFREVEFKQDEVSFSSILLNKIKLGQIEIIPTYDYSIGICDLDFNVGWAIGLDGFPIEVVADQSDKPLNIGGAAGIDGTVSKAINGITVLDSSGNPLFYFDKDGQLITKTPFVKFSAINSYAELIIAMLYGQSNSVGANALPIITTAQPYPSAYRFVGGVRAEDAGTDPTAKFGSLVPLTEQESSSLGETPVSGFVMNLIARLQTLTGIEPVDTDLTFLGCAPGTTGQSMAQLSKPGANYTKVLNNLAAARDRSIEISKIANLPMLAFIQGEQDMFLGTTKATYKSQFLTFKNDFQTDVKATLGQKNNPHIAMWQVASLHNASVPYNVDIPLAQAELCRENADCHMIGPGYILDYQGDNTHFINYSSKIIGAYAALCLERMMLGQAWKPLDISNADFMGTVIELTYDVPCAPLVFDAGLMMQAANNGFNVFDASGNAVTINSVEIVRGNVVKLVCAVTVTTGFRVKYAINSITSTGRKGSRGNLRDSQGDTIKLEEFNWPLHNWALINDITL